MNRTIKCCLIVALLALAGCTTAIVPTPWGYTYYTQAFQKKGLKTKYKDFEMDYNTEVDPTVMAIVQAFEAGKKAAAK